MLLIVEAHMLGAVHNAHVGAALQDAVADAVGEHGVLGDVLVVASVVGNAALGQAGAPQVKAVDPQTGVALHSAPLIGQLGVEGGGHQGLGVDVELVGPAGFLIGIAGGEAADTLVLDDNGVIDVAQGIGAAAAILFARKGWNVVINYNESYESASLLARSLSSNGFSAMIHKANVANKLEVDLMVKETVYKFGSVDVLINNAGVSYQGLITDTDEIDYDRIIDVNLKGVFNCCKAVTPVMVNQKSGKIINISSMWGQVGASCEVVYSAAKAGVIGLTKALAKELAPSGITVNAIAPGLIETNMNSNISVEDLNSFVESIPLGRMGSADEIAEAAFFLSSENADYITGQVLGVNGGFVM